jgi:hypothetical protein
MQRLPKVAAKYVNITATATLATGVPTTIAGVDVAVVPPGTTPTAVTAWVSSHWVAPVAQVLLIGPAAMVANPPAYSLHIPATGGDLWARVLDTPEVDAALIDHIELE